MNAEKLALSLVIPVFNEEKRLEPRLSESIAFLESVFKEGFEVVFVNDGSTDGSLTVLEGARQKFPNVPIKIIGYPKNEGKGFAVKMGVLEAAGAKVVVSDADFSVDLREITKFIEGLESSDIVIGSKKHLLTSTARPQKVPRRILGKGFTFLSNALLGLNFTDITCGFRGFRADVAKNIFGRQRMRRWSYDAETLFLAKRFKYRICELPVSWHHIEGSKVDPILDTFRSLKDLVVMILNSYYGKYNH